MEPGMKQILKNNIFANPPYSSFQKIFIVKLFKYLPPKTLKTFLEIPGSNPEMLEC